MFPQVVCNRFCTYLVVAVFKRVLVVQFFLCSKVLKGALSPYLKVFFDSFFILKGTSQLGSQGRITTKVKYETENKQG